MRSVMMMVASLALVALAACGSGESSTGSSECAGGARVVRVRGLDTLRFDPAQVAVQVGEPVCFVVTNAGETEHEFVIGDRAMQEQHEQEMASGEGMAGGEMDMAGMREVKLGPGETKSVTTTFDAPGTTMYACHEPGHYTGGMIGTITITA